MLQMADLQAAWQCLDGADHTRVTGRSSQLLKEADQTFQKYRNFYYALIQEMQSVTRPELSLA
jgi:hypothetical protein